MERMRQGSGGFGKAMGQGLRGFGSLVGRGLEGAAATAVVAGGTLAAQKAYDALTKTRDFKNMMTSPFNDDLAQHHEANPHKFNAAFTSLRTVNPELTRDPMTAGAYMRRVMQYDNAGATGVMVEALAQREKMPLSPLLEASNRGAQAGVAHVFTERANMQRAHFDLANAGARETSILDARLNHPSFERNIEDQKALATHTHGLRKEYDVAMAAQRANDEQAARVQDQNFRKNLQQQQLDHQAWMALSTAATRGRELEDGYVAQSLRDQYNAEARARLEAHKALWAKNPSLADPTKSRDYIP